MARDPFGDLMAEIKNDRTTDDLAEHAEARTQAGDPCPDGDCDHDLYELRHPRDPETEIPRAPNAPEVELVCIHHGVMAAR